MDTRWIKLCFLLILCTEQIFPAHSVTLQGSIDPNPAIKTQQHIVRCDFTFQPAAGETVEGFRLYLGNTADQAKTVAQMRPLTGGFVWSATVPDNLQQRGYLLGSRDEGYFHMVINSTECPDKDRQYLCQLEYYINGGATSPETSSITALSQMQAYPTAPIVMTRDPNEESVMEFSNMTFECRGNVGRPAGSFRWFRYIGSGNDAGIDVTNKAVDETETLSGDGCTYNRVSRLTMNLSRTEPNERLVVQCRVDQVLADAGATGCDDSTFCAMSPQISVQYPVEVSITGNSGDQQQGTTLTLTCQTSGNPAPSVPTWFKPDNTTTTGDTLTVSSLTMDDTGDYVCTTSNTIDGVQYNRSSTATVRVVLTTTTTTTSTTTPKSTTTPAGGGGSGAQNDNAGSDTTTIIIVVVVVLVVIIIIAIVAVCIVMKRKKAREVEEPPEKPFNNNAGINTVAARPDLVSNSYDQGSPYKNEDGLGYAELQFDNKPRSRRPLAIDDSHTDYSDVSMPQV